MQQVFNRSAESAGIVEEQHPSCVWHIIGKAEKRASVWDAAAMLALPISRLQVVIYL